VVDQLIGLREVVVRAVSDPLVNLPGIFGATDLGDGRAVLILDTLTLLFQGEEKMSGQQEKGEKWWNLS
jgi:chemotaxis protein histidine kinase CheA